MMTGYGGPPPVAAPGPGLVERLGERVTRRAEPRFGVALAGVGMLMIVAGVVAWGGDATGDGDGDDPNRILGVLLSLAVIAAGYALLVLFRRGALASAGVVAAALGVPLLFGFATFDPDSVDDADVYFALPFAVDAIVLLSLAAWLATYVWVPVARGRVLLLALSTFTLWLYLLEKVEEGAAGYVLTLPYSSFVVSFSSSFDSDPQVPDPGSIGGPSLILGLLYYVVAVVADRQGYRGLATPFLAAGFVATVVGIVHMADDLDFVGTGLLLIVLGSALALYGVTHGRRFTAWVWAAAIGLGVLVILLDAFEESAAGFGVSAIVLGAAVVVLGHVIAEAFSEPDEMVPGPSRFTPRRPGPPRPPPGAAGYPPAGGSWAPPAAPMPPGPPLHWSPPTSPSAPPSPAPPSPVSPSPASPDWPPPSPPGSPTT